ncbi:MAG: MarR family transcriptional regulator [Candidatus Omnitrophica bacterium]|nr:MarR family transcriptional regulator [Candidatus Omnitrophota bacterium]
MNIEEFSQKIIELLPQVSRGFAHYAHDYLTKGEITLPQFWVLNYLYCKKKAKMGELAQFLRTARPAITGLVDRLITQKLVIRKDDPLDRRIVWIELTPQGRNVIQGIRAQKIKALVKIFAKVSSDDRSRYIGMLENVVKIINLPEEQEGKK